MSRPEVGPAAPDSWGPRKITGFALTLYDTVTLLGRRIRYEEWKAKFHPLAGDVSARRTWERLKFDLRTIGLEFTLSTEDGTVSVATLVLESEAHAHEVVDALIGPACTD